MNDHELLELAAKAAGYGALLFCPTSRTDGFYSVEETDGGPLKTWNPLTDDGDALRLAVRLRYFPQLMVMGKFVGFDDLDIVEDFTEDPLAATRRAIVRAAAEIGKKMKEKEDEQ